MASILGPSVGSCDDAGVNTGDLEVISEGAGAEAIVMVHGWPDTHRLWDAQVGALQARYRCVRFTLPGFAPGHPKQAYSLDELVETIRFVAMSAGGGAPVTLLLHDWGCFFGYPFALRHPGLVRRVIGVDIGDAGSRAHRREIGLKGVAWIVAYQLWLAAAWHVGGPLGDRMARWLATTFRAPAAASVSAQMGYPYAVQWTGAAGGFGQAKTFRPACPMLFIYGRRKPVMFHSGAWADDVGSRPGSRVLAFDSGHWVMVEQPEPFNQAVIDWLAATDEQAMP